MLRSHIQRANGRREVGLSRLIVCSQLITIGNVKTSHPAPFERGNFMPIFKVAATLVVQFPPIMISRRLVVGAVLWCLGGGGGDAWGRTVGSVGRTVASVGGVSAISSDKNSGEVKGISSFRDFNGRVDLNAFTPLDENQLPTVFTGKSTSIYEQEGRHMKRKKLMMRMALWMKTLALGVVLPSAVILALFTAWKGITISLMAFMLAGIVGLKGLVASASKSSTASSHVPHHLVVSGLPSHHQHYWKRLDVAGDAASWDSSHSHQFAYRAYS